MVNSGKTLPERVAESRLINFVKTPGRDDKGLTETGKDVDTATHDKDKDPITSANNTYLDRDYITREGKKSYGHFA